MLPRELGQGAGPKRDQGQSTGGRRKRSCPIFSTKSLINLASDRLIAVPISSAISLLRRIAKKAGPWKYFEEVLGQMARHRLGAGH
jgi:hypothetical protein